MFLLALIVICSLVVLTAISVLFESWVQGRYDRELDERLASRYRHPSHDA